MLLVVNERNRASVRTYHNSMLGIVFITNMYLKTAGNNVLLGNQLTCLGEISRIACSGRTIITVFHCGLMVAIDFNLCDNYICSNGKIKMAIGSHCIDGTTLYSYAWSFNNSLTIIQFAIIIIIFKDIPGSIEYSIKPVMSACECSITTGKSNDNTVISF